jgi:hypothetical protein
VFGGEKKLYIFENKRWENTGEDEKLKATYVTNQEKPQVTFVILRYHLKMIN